MPIPILLILTNTHGAIAVIEKNAHKLQCEYKNSIKTMFEYKKKCIQQV